MSDSSPPTSEPREIAGRYEIIRKLGAGAFGTVYRAKDKTLGRELAIKTIRLEGLAAASVDLGELQKRFKLEATAGAALKHPNIVTVYDFGESEGLTYLAMEYVEGVGLDRIIREVKKLPVDRAAAIAAQVADALGYAHEKKVVHRDIKPANIMVEPGERVKVTDFGIARVTDSAENLTATGGILGTPSYMSPEQARGRTVDGRSDLFSVGCILYELLTGQKAFTGDNISAIIFKIIAEEPPSIQELDPLLSDEMVQIVKKTLAKEPDARYQTGRELAEDLLALAHPGHVPTVRQADVPTAHRSAPGDVPTIASAPTAPGPVTPPAVASAAGVGTAPPPVPTQLLGDAGTAAPPPVPSAPARRPAPATPRRQAAARKSGAGRVVAFAAVAALLLIVGAGGAWFVFGRGGEAPAVEDDAVEVATGTPGGVEATPAVEPTAAPAPGAAAGGGAESVERAPAVRKAEPPAAAPPRTAPPVQPSGGAGSGGKGTGSGVTGDGATKGALSGGGAASAAPANTSAAPAPPMGDDSFLDELPEPQATDGRAAGQALAQAYGSGSAPAYGSQSRFKRRPRIPRDTRPAEQPAVRALAWILSAEKAHFERTGRYGTLSELVDSGDLPLNGPRTADGFDRRNYRVTVSASGEAFRADARPLSPQGRPFYVDENGFVLENQD